MSSPRKAEPVKLMASLFSPEKDLVSRVIDELSEMFGPVEWTSPECFFDRTRYYEKEMGWPLHRRFIAFERLISPEHIVSVKLQTNGVEEKYVLEGKRRINIDPGYVSAERMILATGKNYVHRVYLSDGIYADLTLVFRKGNFEPLPWTYKDYADPVTRGYIRDMRGTYMSQRREEMCRGQEHDCLRQGGA